MNDAPLIFAAILDGPIGSASEAHALSPIAPTLSALNVSGRVGATLRFDGIVRRDEPSGSPAEDGSSPPFRPLAALDYQSYDPMAQRELESLARDVARESGLIALIALHSRGRVRVGEASFMLTIFSVHRSEALAGMSAFIDRLKRDVPIWKSPVWTE